MSQRLESAASTRRLTPMKHQGHMRSDTTSTTTGFCIAGEWLCLALVSAFARPASPAFWITRGCRWGVKRT